MLDVECGNELLFQITLVGLIDPTQYWAASYIQGAPVFSKHITINGVTFAIIEKL
jgi:hypothetical protein